MTPERETAHFAHGTGRPWLDLTLALSAIFISIISLIVAVRHGAAMDRLVAANSWPFLTYATTNQDAKGDPRISLRVENAGVGPARIETFEVWWGDQPIASSLDLLRHCCMSDPGVQIDRATARAMRLSVGVIAPSVLRAGDAQTFLSLERTDANAEIWNRLDTARIKIRMRACYCSVFDECWESDLVETNTKEVKVCPVPKVPFHLSESWFSSSAEAPAPSN